jgi:hypothetical protein
MRVIRKSFSLRDSSSLLHSMTLKASFAARSWMPRTREVQNDVVISETRTPIVRVSLVRRERAIVLGVYRSERAACITLRRVSSLKEP